MRNHWKRNLSRWIIGWLRRAFDEGNPGIGVFFYLDAEMTEEGIFRWMLTVPRVGETVQLSITEQGKETTKLYLFRVRQVRYMLDCAEGADEYRLHTVHCILQYANSLGEVPFSIDLDPDIIKEIEHLGGNG